MSKLEKNIFMTRKPLFSVLMYLLGLQIVVKASATPKMILVSFKDEKITVVFF
jgi:hypothetical protein